MAVAHIVRRTQFKERGRNMILEREDWEESRCCLRPQDAAVELPHGKISVPEACTEGVPDGEEIGQVIADFDRLLAQDAKEEAGRYLEDWLERFEKNGDWACQITILNEMMGFYRNTGEKEKGLDSVKRGLALVREHELSGTVSGGTTFVNAATTMKAFGESKEAMAYYEQAFRVYGKSLAPDDYRFGGLFHNMALAFEDLGEYKRAEIYYKKAMEIMERLRPGSIMEIAVTWVNLAVLYEKWGREEEIDLCLNKAMDSFHARDVVRDAYYAFNCRKCADTFGHFGYFRMKKELNCEADRIYREVREKEEQNAGTGAFKTFL